MEKVKNLSIVFLAAALIVTLLVGCILVLIPKGSSVVVSELAIDNSNSDIEIIQTSEAVSFEIVDGPVFLSGGGSTGVTKSITAMFTPANTYVGALSWSVAWATDNSFGTGKNISDYVVILQDEIYPSKVYVTCKQSFSGNVVLKVVAAEVGVTGTGIITYKGRPTQISSLSFDSYINISNDVYIVNTEEYLDISYVLSNGIGSIHSDFKAITPEISISGVGSSTFKGYRKKTEISDWSVQDETMDIPLSALAVTLGGTYLNPTFDGQTGKLSLRFLKPADLMTRSIAAQYGQGIYDEPVEPATYPRYKFELISLNGGYFTLTLTYKLEGQVVGTKTIKFYALDTATEASLGEIEF